MKTENINVHISDMTIIKHYLDAEHLMFDAYRVGWEGGNGAPRTPIAIRIGRSSESGELATNDFRPTKYVPVDHDKDFRLTRDSGGQTA